MKTIAFVGLGSMGLPMAANLAAKGHAVSGYDMRADARAALAEAGGRAARDIADASAQAEALILMVVNAAQAENVLFEAGALEQLSPDAVVCLMATCPPSEVAAIAARVEASGRRFVDCPVSGGVVGARAGSLTIMAAAPAAVFDEIAPVLRAMGQRVFHVGERAGQGATVKAINQLLCGVHLAAAAEALALGLKVGLDAAVLLDIVGSSAASSWMLKDRGERMLQTEPEVTSAVDIFVKDLGIVMQAGRDAKAALPLAATAHQLFLSASGAGDGALDDSQVIGAYKRLNAIS
ncbi:NAD(P)-dependent oxidoreductase [Aurantimonas sp. Leaf443]|uniref:NAD(P)-dependent oxidoreductase n=1 Tax=Aurantimonas sp. Leaf443 TaxID=1736378 RepID=UPI0006FFBE63|nr:NAD(P)-dependent oxidoreductase [Aurantimonas sp. Leaf443]KQT83833.1 oxidoreductase [Aurantimonas sp. Leaf443]